MKTLRIALCTLLLILAAATAALAQDTGTFTGTVHDTSGAVVVGAEVTISNNAIGVSRVVRSNTDGDWLVAGLPIGTYNITVTAKGFKKSETRGVVLRVAQKARIDTNLEVGSVTTEVTVAGAGMAQVETQSSEISGVVTASELSQLELNGRNFTQLVTLTPGVSNQTNQDEGTVGVNGNVQYSINGGRTEYNNWEIDGGDNMDNGSNTSLNVYPSVDAIQEVKVLTSNYGAEYGRNASGTIETETKSGTNAFHGDAYEFVRNDIFNARPYFNLTNPPYKKNDFGYTIGGPIFIPHHYNTDKNKTFFFWSQEWRRERQPTQFNQAVPSMAERGGDFSDLCTLATPVSCPAGPGIVNNKVTTIDPNGAALLGMIPAPNATTASCGSPTESCFVESFSQPTTWREELIRVDHNLNSKNRLTFRYIHDSWQTVTPTTLWGDLTSTFPTINTNFVGPGTSFVAKIATTASPTLLNEFVFSYTADHINLTNTGTNWVRPANSTQTGLFNNGFGGKLSGIDLINDAAYGGGFAEDPAYIPWTNANPTYTFRDNVTKIIGSHNLQFGFYAVAAQKNEVNSNIGSVTGDVQGILTFDASNTAISSGNAFADLLLGNIASYQQDNQQLKYYNRYKIVEPYLQDDWHITSRLTLNLGLRLSLFGTYYEKYKRAYNWELSAFNPNNAPGIDPNTGALIDPTTGNPLPITDPRIYNGIVQCGAPGVPRGCMQGHLFNPAPRIGFAWDPKGDGKTSIRAGYGIFFEHTNGNEGNTESLEGSPPLVLSPSQGNITGGTCGGPSGYQCIGGGGLVFPLNVTAIPGKATWPYSQQYSLSVEREVFKDTVATVAYVGSKGTHLTLQQDINQIFPTSASQNPYTAGVPMTSSDCSSGVANGVPVSSLPQTVQNNFNTACSNVTTVDPFRPHLGFGNIQFLGLSANSEYNSLQATLRRTVGPVILNAAYTYSHSIDDFSDRSDSTFVNSYDLQANRASSNFDQRHLLSLSYVYELPNFHEAGWKRTLLGGWEWTGITTYSTGTPFTVVNALFSDNAGVANGASGGSYPDLVGNPRSAIPAADQNAVSPGVGVGPLYYNPSAFSAPTGLTFGDSGRNSLNNPNRLNFDMGLFKHFPIHEAIAMEFRAEAFNVFNHTEFYLYNSGNGNTASNQLTCVGANNNAGDPTCLSSGNTAFLRPAGAHNNRILQLGLKLYF